MAGLRLIMRWRHVSPDVPRPATTSACDWILPLLSDIPVEAARCSRTCSEERTVLILRATPLILVLLALGTGIGGGAEPGIPGMDHHYLSYGQIPKQELRDAIGVLTVTCVDPNPLYDAGLAQFADRCRSFPTYEQNGDQFEPGPGLEVGKTAPLTGFSYDSYTTRRFPVTDKRGGFLKVVWDCTNDKRTWVRFDNVNQLLPGTRTGSAWYFCFNRPGLDCGQQPPTEIDMVYLLASDSREVYSQPSEDAPSEVLTVGTGGDLTLIGTDGHTRRDVDAPGYVILEQRNGFALLAGQDWHEEERFHPIGWLRVFDKGGLLSLWPIDYGC
jgi:hypothetical protein